MAHRLTRPLRLTVPALGVASLLALLQAAPASSQVVDDDEGQGRALLVLPHFDPAARTGALLALTADGESLPVMQRAGEAVQQLVEVPLGAMSGSLAVWRPLDGSGDRHVELWLAEGYPTLVWGGTPRVLWADASLEVRRREGETEVRVERSLVGENRASPALRQRELYRVTAQGLELEKVRTAAPETPEQRLNWIAELGQRRRFEDLAAAVKRLPRRPVTYLQRAAILMTRYGEGVGMARTGRELVELLARESDTPEVVEAAADRLLEMEWEATE